MMNRPTRRRSSRRVLTRMLASGPLIAGLNALTRDRALAGDGTMKAHLEKIPPLDGSLSFDAANRAAYAQDYGQIVHERPLAVLKPGSIEDVSRIVRFAHRRGLRVIARGHGHQPFGQAQARGGIVIDMTSLQTVHSVAEHEIDVDAGASWRTVVRAAHPYGVTPPVLTNDLSLTVGGTLSIGGIGLATFRHGTQADQTTQLQVVTGEGDVLICSEKEHRDLFEATLVGQGQCGVIVRAVLRTEPLRPAVREYVLPYIDLASLMQAGQRVRDDRRFDGVVAMIVPTPQRWSYLLSAIRYFAPPAAPDDAQLLADLKFIAGAERIRSVDYLEYMDTKPPLDPARSHADLGLYLPQSASESFIDDMLPRLTERDLGTAAAMRVFFLDGARFTRPLLRAPQESAFNYVALLRTETNDSDALDRMLSGNRRLFEDCRKVGGSLYPFAAVRMSSSDWVRHYGSRWPALREARRRYDPHRVFGAGVNLPL